jgi:site-specific DNA-adenine methylase
VIPCFAYPGGKCKIREHILRLLPPRGQRYVEPFAGRANVFWAVATKLEYQEFWLNDLLTFPFLDGLKISSLYAIPDWKDPTVFERMRERNRRKVLADGRKFPERYPPAPLLESYLTFNGGTYEDASRRSEKGKGKTQTGFDRDVRNAYAIINKTRPHLTRLDYTVVLAECGSEDVVFLDPPYYENCDVRGYKDDMLNHHQMIDLLLNARFRWVLSEYPDEIYVRAFGKPLIELDCQKIIKANARGRGKKSDRAPECLWRNF